MKARICERRYWMAIIVGSIAVLVCGCANLSAIREFAKISASTAEYTQLTKEYVQWPETQKRYEPAEQHATLENVLSQRKSQEKNLLLRHSIIEEYMEALGNLAADEVVTKEVDALGSAVRGAEFITEEEKEKFTAVANVLYTASTYAWRQAKVKDYVRTANSPIKEIIAGLKKIVDEGFLGDLENEEVAVQNHYRKIIKESSDKAGIAALEEWRDSKLESIAKRREVIKTYSLSLQKISDAHQKLYDAVSSDIVISKEFLAQMSRYAKDIQAAYKTITSSQK